LHGRVLSNLLPPPGLARRLSAQSVLFAVGQGTFITGSAVFFTQVVGLSAAQVGLGLTIAGVVTFVFAIPLGRLADRVGPQRTWALAALGEAVLYLAWPVISGFGAYVAMMVVLELVGTAGNAGRGAYTLDAFSGEARIRSLAFMRSALNVGFTLGALLGGLALAFDDLTIIRVVRSRPRSSSRSTRCSSPGCPQRRTPARRRRRRRSGRCPQVRCATRGSSR
jgi:predicted MFS family arabinose efflux permease